MIMPNNGSSFQTNGTTTSFGIEMNASMFQMLTKNVYNDVILAPIREFSTNAIDACIAAKKPIKFDVHLPTEAEPIFFVRDYGTGLSHDDILGLFSLLGASTKRESNEYNGTFGIGRMSGLAYATSFTIDSYHEGKHRSYIVSVDNGIPNTIHLGDVDSTEPNGLKLSIKVKYADIISFHKKAKHLYQFFEHKPNLNIEMNLDIEKIVEGEDWYLMGEARGAFAVMGNVPYRLDSYAFNNRTISDILGAYPVLNVPLGSVSITPGRESLTMDETTTKYLEKRLMDIGKDIVKQAEAQIDHTLSMHDKMLQITDIALSLPYMFRNKFKPALSSTEQKYFSVNHGITAFKHNAQIPNAKLSCLHYYYKTLRTDSYTDYEFADLKFMIGDTRTFLKEAALTYRDKFSKVPRVLVIQQSTYNKDTLPDFVKETQDFLTSIGIPSVLASEYNSHVETKTRAKLHGFHPLTLMSLGTNEVIVRKGTTSIDKFNPSTTYYVNTINHDLQIDQSTINLYLRYIALYNQEHKTDIKIIGVPQKYKAEIEEAGYQPMSAIDKLPNVISFYDGSEEYSRYHRLLSNISSNIDTKVLGTKVVENDDIRQYFADMKNYQNIYKHACVNTSGIAQKFKTVAVVPQNKMAIEDFKNKYPIFEKAITRFTLSEFNRYIRLEDNYNEVCKTGG